MSTVDTAEVRRTLEHYVALAVSHAATDPAWLLRADRLLAYLPLLLDEVEQQRADRERDAAIIQAARVWRRWFGDESLYDDDEERALAAAVDAVPAGGEIRRGPTEQGERL